MEDDKNMKAVGAMVPGMAIFGCLLTGIGGLIGAAVAFDRDQSVGAGICLLAAAFAFGTVVFVSFRS
jgi:hypothetical protein